MNPEERMNTSWRKVALAIYRKPIDSKILGSVEIDITDLEVYINNKRRGGLKITLTHIFTMAVSRALKEAVPELNCLVKRGSIIPRKQIDAIVSVLLNMGQMGSVRIPNADTLTLQEFTAQFNEEIKQARNGAEYATTAMKDKISIIPWPFRNWLIRLIKVINIDWGINIPFLKLKDNSFGSFLVSNIGTLGLDIGYPALFPISNVPFVLILGGVNKKPFVVRDEIKIRRVINLSIALDHRVVDAKHGGELFKYIKEVVRHPEKLEQKPSWALPN